jgi:DNA invertase Pin-like site-specific DNA recombinase
MKVALYLRRSTDEKLQADSLNAQEESLRHYAADHGMTIVAVFRDSASGVTSRRPAFEEMIKVITHGAAFEAVLCRDVSRFGRFFDVDEGAFYDALFLSHHCQTIYCEEVFGTEISPMAGLIKGIRRVMASEFSRERSRMTRQAFARITRLGFRCGGAAPYGFKRVMVTLSGRKVQDLRRGEWKALAQHRTKLELGDPEKIAVVRQIFESYASGARPTIIAAELNSQGVPARRSKEWTGESVLDVIRDPVYIGTARVQINTKTLVDPVQGNPVVERENAFPQVVSRDLWDRVREIERRRREEASKEQLFAELRRAYESHGSLEPAMLDGVAASWPWARYARRFGSIEGALEEAYATEVERRRAALLLILRGAVPTVPTAGGFRVDEVAVTVRPLFLHRHESGSYWDLDRRRFVGDVIVGFQIGPDASDDWIVLGGSTMRLRHFHRLIRAGGRRYYYSDQCVVPRIRRLVFNCERGIERFIRVARESGVLNLTELARQLHEQPAAVVRRYHLLRTAGVILPPIKAAPGRRVQIRCENCGRVRTFWLGEALERQGKYCRLCNCRLVAASRRKKRE